MFIFDLAFGVRISRDNLPPMGTNELYPPQDKWNIGYSMWPDHTVVLSCANQDGCLLWADGGIINIHTFQPVQPKMNGESGPVVCVHTSDRGSLWHMKTCLTIFEGIIQCGYGLTGTQAVYPAGFYFFVVHRLSMAKEVVPEIIRLNRH